jgi:hypothetical protein
MSAAKKTSLNAKSLPFPKITSLGAVQRAQRHVPDSITTLRFHLSVALANALENNLPRDFENLHLLL